MFQNDELKEHLETSSSIKSQSFVIAEWNMNIAENISAVGNYRYRPTATPDSDDFIYSMLPVVFDSNDCNNEIKFWCGATDADVVIDGGLDADDQPIAFTSPNEKERLLYSLEDCFKRFRPRSGINKLRYFEDGYTHFYNSDIAKRPRYYMSSRKDIFKYWTSYRKEGGIERGIANIPSGDSYYIDDAAPFVVYKNTVPANRVVVKMQTGVGDVNLGPFNINGVSVNDPFYGLENQSTPSNWKIQALKENSWIDLVSFSSTSSRKNGSPVVGSDGYVELAYGIIIPDQYRDSIVIAGSYPMAELLPISPATNSAYLVGDIFYVWTGLLYEQFVAKYGWYLKEEGDNSALVESLVSPDSFANSVGETQYKEFEYIRGLRLVVSTMNKQNATFDLIELSSRLSVDLSEKVSSLQVNKSASDLGVSGMPVGQLLASNGSVELFDYDDSFNTNNQDSILSTFTNNNIQIKIFEKIFDINPDAIKEYIVPIKTMYADGFPSSSGNTRKVSIALRDLFFYLESNNAPDILLENCTLFQAASTLLDGIGFSNYVFKTIDGEEDQVIPYFFIPPDTSVAQVLEQLALATQTAVFFDEENNLAFMSKNYIMPSESDRETDIQLIGSVDQQKSGIVENSTIGTKLSNILDISSKENEIFNDGKIVYQEKYIAKTYGSLKEASFLNQDQNWIYKPALLWEVSGTPPIRSVDGESEKTSSYVLSAVPLNSDLNNLPPSVINNELVNNVIDFGEGAYWVARYNGYFYANGEVIKYDAVEYNVSGIGNVWVSSLTEYQNYFSKIKFGGKLYPTGRIRIYAEPFYETIDGITVMKNGGVRKHGREQFGTTISYHNAGLDSYWSDTSSSAPVNGIEMDSSYLFSSFPDRKLSGVYNQQAIVMDVAIDIDEPSNINDIFYADSKWVAVGNDGDFRLSEDGETWTTEVDDEFDDSFVFNSVYYGNGLWIAVGSKPSGETTTAAMASSENGAEWTEIAHGLTSTSLNKVFYASSKWVVVGNEGLVATSTDGESWTARTSRLDFTVFGSNNPKILSQTLQETVSISKIRAGNPGAILAKNHKLKDNDIITLNIISGSLPTSSPAISASVEYSVKVINKDSFSLKTIGMTPSNIIIGVNGTGKYSFTKKAATFRVVKHGLSDNQAIRVVASESLPSGISGSTIYYVRKISDNSIHLSTSYGGTPIAFVSAQNNSTHKVERFVRNNLFDIEFGNSTWVIGGEGGVFATSSNAETWTAYQTKLKTTTILSITFADSKWVISGSSGKMQRSTDLVTWTAFDAKLSKGIKKIAFGNGVWIAAGEDGKISISSNLSTWKVYKVKFGTSSINALFYADGYWLALGDKLKISKSTDNGITWNSKSQDSVGELLFTTTIPHNFTPFDTVTFSGVQEPITEEGTTVAITVGTPATLTFKKHKLNTNDKIKLTTTGNLPTGLAVNTLYYVIRVSRDTFRLATQINGAAIAASGVGNDGTHQFVLNPIITTDPNTKYYVTPKKITDYSFTLAETREDAVAGVTFKGKGYAEDGNKVELNLNPETENVTKISVQNENVKITTEGSYTPTVGMRVFFAVQKNGEYTDNRIRLGVVRYAPYYIQSVIDGQNFFISETLEGTPVKAVQLASLDIDHPALGETVVMIFNLIPDVLSRNIISPKTINFSVDNLLELTAGEGEITAPTRVSAIRSLNIIKKSVTISIANPAVVSCTSHGLFDGDTIKFVTTGNLPFGIDTNQEYLVNKINNNSFNLFDPFTMNLIETKEGQNTDAEISGDLENNNTQFDISYRPQNGTHSFVKDINDFNKITISRPTAAPIAEYEITTEEVLVDSADGETQVQTYYNNISYNNEITAIAELDIDPDKTKPAGKSETNKNIALAATRNGIIKNYFTRSSFSETDASKFLSTRTGTVQSSAFVFDGPSFEFGSSTPVTISIGNPAIFTTSQKHGLENNDQIRFATSGSLPSGIAANIYYIQKINNTSFSVKTTVAGSLVATTGTQSGIHRFTRLEKNPLDFVSYIHKPLDQKFTHFGTRMRIVGRISQEDKQQIVSNSLSYFLNPEADLDEKFSVFGGSAGIGLMVNPETNLGYYFEVIGLSQSNVAEYSEVGLFNLVFYKTVRRLPGQGLTEVNDSTKAIPIKLWQGVTNVVVDDGTMVGQFRTTNESTPSVYDIAVEYEDIDQNTRRFYLMVNNKVVGIVDDSDPLPVYSNLCLFVRGGTRAMFENVYALSNNYSQNTVFELDAPVNSVFGTESIGVSESFRKYAVSGAVQSTYLSGLSSNDDTRYKIYFEEFGTIMRECSYFNIRYDKAYPALYAKMSETFNKMKGYTVSGFTPTAYGAEFLVFNNTDTALNLDETSGNYLRIQGVTFTQSSDKELTVDDYFENVSNLSDPYILEDNTILSPVRAKEEFLDIKNSRITNGRKEFTVSSPYIQSQDEANNLMSWIISKIMKKRKSVGLRVFSMPNIQLGDIVTIDYISPDGITQIDNTNRFVVYNIAYSRNLGGPSMEVFLSEVI
jgi:photosystem II stability/assembly factor-like uncharacterized protein